jgi:hypothetical protein
VGVVSGAWVVLGLTHPVEEESRVGVEVANEESRVGVEVANEESQVGVEVANEESQVGVEVANEESRVGVEVASEHPCRDAVSAADLHRERGRPLGMARAHADASHGESSVPGCPPSSPSPPSGFEPFRFWRPASRSQEPLIHVDTPMRGRR